MPAHSLHLPRRPKVVSKLSAAQRRAACGRYRGHVATSPRASDSAHFRARRPALLCRVRSMRADSRPTTRSTDRSHRPWSTPSSVLKLWTSLYGQVPGSHRFQHWILCLLAVVCVRRIRTPSAVYIMDSCPPKCRASPPQRVETARAMLEHCQMCEWRCGVSRTRGASVPCKLGAESYVFGQYLSLTEEPEVVPALRIYLG